VNGSNMALQSLRDCWCGYQHLEMHGYAHQTIYHTFGFVYVRNWAHRTRSRARGGKWTHSSIPTTGWRTTSPGPPHVCGGVLIRQRRPLNLLHACRCKHWLERVICPQHWSCGYVTRRRPIHHSSVSSPTPRWNYELLYHILKEFFNTPSFN